MKILLDHNLDWRLGDQSSGHEVRTANSQEAALRELEDTKFDYVLLDLSIPLKEGRLTRLEIGFTLLDRIVQLPGARRPGVIVMTASSTSMSTSLMYSLNVASRGKTFAYAAPSVSYGPTCVVTACGPPARSW